MAQITRLSRLPEVPEEAIDQLLHPAQFYARPAVVARFELRRECDDLDRQGRADR